MNLITTIKQLYSDYLAKGLPGYGRFLIADKVASLLYPPLTRSDYGKIWLEDKDFTLYMRRLVGTDMHTADRRYFLRSLLGLVDNLPGNTAECGVYLGASSWLICDHFSSTDKIHHLFDSFQGLSEPGKRDGTYWSKGAFAAPEEKVRRQLAGYRLSIHKGWIPSKFSEVADEVFCFVHVDVDLYQPTLATVEFFYPRMAPGGIILCDDYGFLTCPGAKRALDEYMNDKPERIIHVPTGQAFIVKR